MPDEKMLDKILEFAKEMGGLKLGLLRDALEVSYLHQHLNRHIESDLAIHGLTVRQVEVLEQLYHHEAGTLTPADLADEVGLTRSAMTSSLDSLEKLGYVSRAQHPSDRRMVVISLTPEGVAASEKHLPHRYQKMHRVVSVLSKCERKTMLRAYTKLLKAIEIEVAADIAAANEEKAQSVREETEDNK